MRLFVAVDLPSSVRQSLKTTQTSLREALRGTPISMVWVKPQQMHVTLRFFPDVDEARVAQLQEALDEASGTLAPFTAGIRGLGVFPEGETPTVLWAGVSTGRSAMIAVHHELTKALAARGWPEDARPFHPHVTLGRVKVAGPRRLLTGIMARCIMPEDAMLTVDRLTLIHSVLSASGPQHTAIYRTNPRTTT